MADAARPYLVAIVGAGPSGIYAAEALTQQTEVDVQVVVLDRLPVPFGLVRYGVAPDHPSIRSIRNTLERTLEKSGVRFFGNVAIGAELTVEELRDARRRSDLRLRRRYRQAAGDPRRGSARAASRPRTSWPGTAGTPTSIPTPTGGR